MIKLDDIQISVLKNRIGKKINYVSSNRFDLFNSEITCFDRILKLSMSGPNKCNLVLQSDFFENEDGEMFHDYILEEDNFETENDFSKYYIESDYIKKIEVLGRQFPLNDFRYHHNIYEKYKGVDITDDAFIFYLMDGEQLMVLFHDYFPTINVYIGSKSIKQFFNNTRSEYSLHHTI